MQLQQPPPLRWPVGEDCVRMLRDRARLTDDEWERLMRSQGWGLAPGDVGDADDADDVHDAGGSGAVAG